MYLHHVSQYYLNVPHFNVFKSNESSSAVINFSCLCPNMGHKQGIACEVFIGSPLHVLKCLHLARLPLCQAISGLSCRTCSGVWCSTSARGRANGAHLMVCIVFPVSCSKSENYDLYISAELSLLLG